MKKISAGLIVGAVMMLAMTTAGWADQHNALVKELRQMREQVKALEARVAGLEALKPSFTNFMPQFSERFHVMHLAGEKGDWAVASHEALELKRLVGASKAIDAEKGKLMEAFMSGPLEKLAGAIDHTSQGAFRKALEETVTNCNACHKAAGSPFIKVALNPEEYLNMRHSHKLKPSKMMGPGMHKH